MFVKEARRGQAACRRSAHYSADATVLSKDVVNMALKHCALNPSVLDSSAHYSCMCSMTWCRSLYTAQCTCTYFKHVDNI